MNEKILKSKFNSALTEKMIDELITKTETAIIKEKEKQSSIIPELQEAKATYELIQEQYDAHQAIINKEEGILSALKTMKTGSEQREVYHTISNTLQKPVAEKGSPIPWKRIMSNILTEKGKFITFDTLLDLTINTPEVRVRKLDKGKIYSAKTYLRKTIGNTRNPPEEFGFYQGKIGLSGWFMDGLREHPNPSYLKNFMG